MTDNDLIRREDALNICTRFPYPEGIANAIADLPAVTVPADTSTWNAAIRAAAEAYASHEAIQAHKWADVSWQWRHQVRKTILALLKPEVKP